MGQAEALDLVEPVAAAPADLESRVHAWGHRVFDLMESFESGHWLSKRRFYRTLMDWAMRDEHFKSQLFRFVDVLPTLHSSDVIVRHLREYLQDHRLRLAPALRLALAASDLSSWIAAAALKQQVTSLARQFMLGNDPREIGATLHRLDQQRIAFTVDVLGETVLSDAEADDYATKCLRLLDDLSREISRWRLSQSSSATAASRSPKLNLSVKISALTAPIHPPDVDGALERIAGRLRPILRRAHELGAFVNFDMEQYSLKALTLQLFQSIFAEPEFKDGPACGLALQAYLRDSEADLENILAWAGREQRRITVRLVKGAYWDYETVVADQKSWPLPVFASKSDTDANYEKLTRILLEHREVAEAAFGTHNVRSISHALACAEELGIPGTDFEFQMLHGMADSTKHALVRLGYRVREYCPVGELLPGMAYLVRRLLENTSNEGFLAQRQTGHAGRDELLRKPVGAADAGGSARHSAQESEAAGNGRFKVVNAHAQASEFRNEPPADFAVEEERRSIADALRKARAELRREHSLIINHQPVQTGDWLDSLNPSDQREVIGRAAQATLAEADAAVAVAKAVAGDWARIPGDRRAAVLENLAALLQRDHAELCALEILEAGKNWVEADADVNEAIDFCRYYARVLRELSVPKRTQRVLGEDNCEEWLARGVGVVIAPWNFPLAILTGMTVATIVAGNAVVIKPSDQTPVIASHLMGLLMEAGVPPGVANLVSGRGSTVGAHLVAHPHVDFIAFTGSKEVGLKIWETAGRTVAGQAGLKKVVCEMGGKNAIIIDNDADFDEAVGGAVASAFGYQGQKCSALSRLIIVEDAYDRVIPRLIEATASLRIGPAELPGNLFGPVISKDAQHRILEAIEAGTKVARLAWQGTVPDDPNACYVPPTIFTDVPADSRLFREEIFGPVLSVVRARDFSEALQLANRSEFALTGGIYSRSPAHIARARQEFVCGNLYINRSITGALVQRQPFGGFKMSGPGTKAGGADYLKNFMVSRVITENCLRRGFAPAQEVPS